MFGFRLDPPAVGIFGFLTIIGMRCEENEFDG
jgi:hypothetical protein